MARPNKGYTQILYVYVTPENRAHIEKRAKTAGSASAYINRLLDRVRAKKAAKEKLKSA